MIIKKFVTSFLICFMTACVVANDNSQQENQGDKVLKEIEEILIPGISEDEARTLFDSHGIEYEFVTADELRAFTVPEISEENIRNIKGQFLGIIRDIEKSGLATTSISIKVDISNEGFVSKVEYEKIYTAP